MNETETKPVIFAPGSWTYHPARVRPDDKIFGYWISVKGKEPFIASAGVAVPQHALIVDEHWRKTVTTGFTEEEVEAAGLLIAAAPGLLAACEMIAGFHGQMSQMQFVKRYGVDPYKIETLELCLSKLSAAIAAAQQQ